jgi:ABC-type branched-subunit amino acid transport system permease subunit
VALVVMAFAFPEHANAMQTSTFETVRTVFVGGMGALIGIIGGKLT